MNQPTSLQAGTAIDGYEIRESLWTTSSGFIYRASEPDRDRDVLIQEFIPASLATRHWSGIHAMPLEGLAGDFEQGLTRFLREARILAQIKDPYVCRLYEYTEANATAYMVLDYEPGQTLQDHLASRQIPLDEGEIRKLLVPLLKGLRVAHEASLLHRDIHPANVYLRDVGPPILIGFGSPVIAVRGDDDPHIENRVAPGYSPVEQYQSDGALGPWSDLYALGATMYRCLSGAAPVDAAHRVTDIAQGGEDPLVPATELGISDYSSGLLSAIDWMMEPMAGDRPETAGAVLGPLTEERAPRQPVPPADRHAIKDTPRPGRSQEQPGPGEPASKSARPRETPARRSAPPHRAPPATDRTPGAATPPPATARPAPARGRRSGAGRTWLLLMALAGVAVTALFVLRDPPGPPAQHTSTGVLPSEIELRTPGPAPDNAYPPPDLPEKVNFGRERDDQRADAFRDLDHRTAQIDELLASADQNMAEGRLVSPAGSNALADYRAVLELDPAQTDARLGITAIQNDLLASAETAFADRDLEEAERLLHRAVEIRGETDRSQALAREIRQHRAEKEEQARLAREAAQRREAAQARAEQARLEEIQRLIGLAEEALEAERLTRPPGENALAYFQRVLRLEPGHEEARQGVERIGRSYLTDASDAMARDELERADGLLGTAAAILPENEAILLLRKQLETRRAAAAQRRREQELQASLEAQMPQTPAPPPAEAEPEPGPEESRSLERGIDAYYAGDYDIAHRLLKPLADDGQPRAAFRLAMMYYHGRGVAEDAALAETLIREALPEIREHVAEGAAWAQADLASLYADGIVVAENDGEAVRLYRLAAEQGYAGAQTNLGVMYANGEGVSRSREDAVRWLRRAAAQGDRIAGKNLQALGVQ